MPPARRPWLATPFGLGAVPCRVSWNGSTNVASWRVLAGPSAGALTPVAQAPRSGFQSTISVAAPGPYVEVQALDAGGAVHRRLRPRQGLGSAAPFTGRGSSLVIGPMSRSERARLDRVAERAAPLAVEK